MLQRYTYTGVLTGTFIFKSSIYCVCTLRFSFQPNYSRSLRNIIKFSDIFLFFLFFSFDCKGKFFSTKLNLNLKVYFFITSTVISQYLLKMIELLYHLQLSLFYLFCLFCALRHHFRFLWRTHLFFIISIEAYVLYHHLISLTSP